MIQEAIQQIAEMAREANKTSVLIVPNEPKDVYHLVHKGGTIERRTAEPRPREYRASSLTGLCQQINYFNTADATLPICVFVGRGQIVVSLDEKERRESIRMALDDTEGFKLLEGMKAPRKFDQKSLIWTLRTTFNERVAPADFLPDVRQLRFKSGDDGEATVGVGNESLRRSVQQSVAMGGKDLVGRITIEAEVYDGLPEIVASLSKKDPTFDVAVDVDLTEQKLVLKTMPGECEQALIDAHEAISEYIVGQCPGVTVFVDSLPG